MNKKILIGSIIAVAVIVIGSLITVSSNICAINANKMNEPGDSYHFQDVDVLIFGRCRSISSFDTWHGGLFVGDLEFFGVSTTNQPFERFNIFIKNQSSGEIFLELRLQYHSIQSLNASGVFFWGAIGSGFRTIPPIIIIKCHAEKLAISEGPWED